MRDRCPTNGDPTKRPLTSSAPILSQFLERPYSVYVLMIITLCYASNQLNRYILTSVSEGLETGIGFGDGDGESFLYGMLVGPTTTIPFCIGMVAAGHLADRYQAWKVRLLFLLVLGMSIPHACIAFVDSYWLLTVLRATAILLSSGYGAVAPTVIADYFPQQTRGLAVGVFGFGQPIGQGLVFGMGNALTARYDYRVALFASAIWAVPLAFLMVFTVHERGGLQNQYSHTATLLPKKQLTSESHPEQEYEVLHSPGAFAASGLALKTRVTVCGAFKKIFMDEVLLCIYVGGAFKYISTLNWQYFRNQFFRNFHGMPEGEIAEYMSWIPIVAGIMSALLFGYISDMLVRRGWGALGRILVVAVLNVLSLPMIVGVLFAPVYGVFAFVFFDELFQKYFVAGGTWDHCEFEYWWSLPMIVGVLFAPVYGVFAFVFFDELFQKYFVAGLSVAIIHMIPPEYQVSAISYGWMFIWMIGGTSTLLSPILADYFDGRLDHRTSQNDNPDAVSDGVGLRVALEILYFGGMCMAAIFFNLAAWLFWRKYGYGDGTEGREVKKSDVSSGWKPGNGDADPFSVPSFYVTARKSSRNSRRSSADTYLEEEVSVRLLRPIGY